MNIDEAIHVFRRRSGSCFRLPAPTLACSERAFQHHKAQLSIPDERPPRVMLATRQHKWENSFWTRRSLQLLIDRDHYRSRAAAIHQIELPWRWSLGRRAKAMQRPNLVRSVYHVPPHSRRTID